MERLAALIAEHAPEFSELTVDELGHNKITADVYHSVAPTLHWNYYAKVGREHTFAEVREADLTSMAGAAGGLIMKYESKSLLVREPVGVVAALTAFNFPLPGIAQKIAPAIVAGCTAVVKAPDPDPLTLFAMADLVTEAGFPPGVINIVAATREASEHLVAHPDVDMVTFTGSTEVGKKIGEVCGAQVKRCVLELGGKSAAIILEDADLDTAIPMVVALGAGTTQGENCTCMSRILAPQGAVRRDRGAGHRGVQDLKVGDPHAADTVVGPLVTEAHRNRVLGYIKTAVDEGATVAFGGGIPEHLEQGWYVEPTLLTNVSNDSTVAQEEIFGPVIVVIPYDDEEDAVRLANDSKFGLSGSVFTGDPVKGFEIARRIRTGTFRVNTMSADFNSSFGGYKESGHRPRARPVRDRRVPAGQDDLDRAGRGGPGRGPPRAPARHGERLSQRRAARTRSPRPFMPPCADWPPSTAISAPLIQLDSSEIRKTTSGATSSAAPARPSGMSAMQAVDERLRRLGHRRGHRAGEDRVDADAERPQLGAGAARDAAQAPLARRVGGARSGR